MSDFLDATCPRCKRRIGWVGKCVDRPACRCGHAYTREQLEEFDREDADLLNKLLAKMDKEKAK